MGASLPKPVTCTVLERHESETFRVGLAEMNGWRGSMEDAHVVHMQKGEGYFGILDGHGGAECSAWCARRLQEKLAAHGLPADDAAAKRLCLETDQAYLDTKLDSGSTAAMCAVRKVGEKYALHVINAGDSRVLLSRADGTIVDGGGTDSGLTVDHKPDHPGERERIYRCGGTVQCAAGGVYRVNGDLAVSRGFGDAEYKKTGGPGLEDHPVTADPEMGHFECAPGDFLLVVCDGVSEGNFPNPEVCELAARVLKETGGDAAKASEAVCFKAVETDSKDNISCMIVLMGGAYGVKPGAKHGMTREFVAGCLLGSGDSGYVKAYTAMCERGGVTFADAVEQRHNTVLGRQGTAEAEADDEAELSFIGEPDGAAGSAKRKAWYQNWSETCTERGGGAAGSEDGEDGPLGAGMSGRSPQEQAMMMKMLMGMMQQRGGGGGGPPPAGL